MQIRRSIVVQGMIRPQIINVKREHAVLINRGHAARASRIYRRSAGAAVARRSLCCVRVPSLTALPQRNLYERECSFTRPFATLLSYRCSLSGARTRETDPTIPNQHHLRRRCLFDRRRVGVAVTDVGDGDRRRRGAYHPRSAVLSFTGCVVEKSLSSHYR